MFQCESPPSGEAAKMAALISELVPVITTDRLTLTAPTVADFALYADVVCSERGRYVGGPMTREDAWYDFIQLASSWMLHGHGGWRVAIHNNDKSIGFVVLGFEPGDREVELGYLFCEQFEGNGYATEATTAVRDRAFLMYGWDSLVSYIHKDNSRSVKLAAGLGATRDIDAEADIDVADIHVYRHRPVVVE